MSSSSSPVLVVELSRARWRVLPAGMLLCAGLTLPWLSDLSWVYQLLICIAACLVAGCSLFRATRVGVSERVRRVAWLQEGEWQLQLQSGEVVQLRLLQDVWLCPWLIYARFKAQDGRRYHLSLWRAEFSSSAWHQWQLRLRLEAGRDETLRLVGQVR